MHERVHERKTHMTIILGTIQASSAVVVDFPLQTFSVWVKRGVLGEAELFEALVLVYLRVFVRA